jgi:hypothetical protein
VAGRKTVSDTVFLPGAAVDVPEGHGQPRDSKGQGVLVIKHLMLVGLIPFALFLYGCSITLNSNVPFQYTPSLISSEGMPYRLGVEKLQDKRPNDDRETTENIKDVDEKITVKLIDDLRSSQLFSSVQFPVNKNRDDFVLQGELRRFSWKASTNTIVWIPIINFAIYFGAPIISVDSSVQLHVQLIDAKTSTVVGDYTKSAEQEKSYSLY